jgi:hypothetical protein
VLTVAALRARDVLLAGSLLSHRLRPVRGRPELVVRVWCPECRHEHCFPWPHDARHDSAVPATLPCRDCPWSGRRVYVGLDPARHDENRRVSEEYVLQARRFLIRDRIERELEMERAAFERRYAAGDFRGATAGPPAGHLGETHPAGLPVPDLAAAMSF